jgi:hypothetical protein
VNALRKATVNGTDNYALYETHKLLESFNYIEDDNGKPCGCIRRGDGQMLRYCARHHTSRSLSGRQAKVAE